MRYSREHKEQTRERIVREASRHFRRRGGKGLAIADLMGKLNLTHGGFYKHFGSKDELLAQAVAKAFDESSAGFMEGLQKAKPGSELRMIIEHYLSLEHCSNPGEGCPMAALSSEISRYPRPVRVAINEAMKARIKRLAQYLPGKTGKEREQNCLVLMSGMMGAINVARATVDLESRKFILEAAKSFYTKAFCS
jgi:TetR/AcrR family transcriptional regulator, transcriptional repressor for nem operon